MDRPDRDGRWSNTDLSVFETDLELNTEKENGQGDDRGNACKPEQDAASLSFHLNAYILN